MHSTNYFNTFIRVADDCPVHAAETPVPKNDKPTVASMQYEMLAKHPYKYTSDEVIFSIHARRNGIESNATQRAAFFSKGQPCMRSSPLTKRYGWGVHSNAEGKIAIFAVESTDYKKLAKDSRLVQTKGMRSSRA
jgi:hypothetical protein